MVAPWFKKGSLDHKTRRLNARIKKLRGHYKEVEFRGCYTDKDLAAKEIELNAIRQEILTLEHERERLWAAEMRHEPTGETRREEDIKTDE